MSKLILIIEDETSIQNIIKAFLRTPATRWSWLLMAWKGSNSSERTSPTWCFWI